MDLCRSTVCEQDSKEYRREEEKKGKRTKPSTLISFSRTDGRHIVSRLKRGRGQIKEKKAGEEEEKKRKRGGERFHLHDSYTFSLRAAQFHRRVTVVRNAENTEEKRK